MKTARRAERAAAAVASARPELLEYVFDVRLPALQEPPAPAQQQGKQQVLEQQMEPSQQVQVQQRQPEQQRQQH